MQTEKYVKESNSAPARGEASQSASTPNSLLLALVPTNTYKIPVLESILEKTLGYVLRESSWERNRMCIIILEALSLKVTAPNLLELLVFFLMKIKENQSLLLIDLLCSLTRIKPQSNQI